jgi:hypothetical protein
MSFLLLCLPSCTTAPSSTRHVSPDVQAKNSDKVKETFQSLWEKWTVQFGTTSRGKSLGFLSTPFSETGGKGSGGGGSEFPLAVEATLMDSTLIEEGFQYFTNRVEMTPEEETTFRSKYSDRFDPANHFLVWCKLRTRYAANYLNLDRWIIYIEDDGRDRFEPEQMIKEPPSHQHEIMEEPQAFQTEMEPWSREIHRQSLMLCFPKDSSSSTPVLSATTHRLKLVFQLNDDRELKAEGIWIVK